MTTSTGIHPQPDAPDSGVNREGAPVNDQAARSLTHLAIERDATALQQLIDVVAQLRGPGGCPWDREQTHESLVQYLIEESYELVDAIETGDRDAILEELGDVLYQVLFHAEIAAHAVADPFTIQDVAEGMRIKMIGRHQHVFGDDVAETADAVMAQWEDVKAREKPERTSVLDGIPLGMPALALADKILGRAKKLGVGDDGEPGTVLALPKNEGGISSEALSNEHELGTLLFGIVASAQSQGLDAERALRTTVREFGEEVRRAETARSAIVARQRVVENVGGA